MEVVLFNGIYNKSYNKKADIRLFLLCNICCKTVMFQEISIVEVHLGFIKGWVRGRKLSFA